MGKMEDKPSQSRGYICWCIWCDRIEHDRHDCTDNREASQKDHINYEGNQIYSMETRQILKVNFGKGGRKKLFEEASGPSYYSMSTSIHIGELQTSHIEF